jgi:hypothetical protein
LVGLVRLVLHADHQISAAEQDVLAELERRLGRARWNQAVRAARGRFTAPEALLAEARQVRTRVRRPMFTILVDLAGCDDPIAGIDVLRWLAAEWGLTDPGPEE